MALGWSLALIAACGGTEAPTQEPTEPSAESPAPVASLDPNENDPEPRSAPESEAAVLLQAEGDVDGDGTADSVELRDNGDLRAGSLQGVVELTDADEYFMNEQAALSVVDFDRGVRAVLVALPTEESEDPPNRYQLFVPRDGGLARILDVVIGAYGPIELRFSGNGTAEHTEDGWTACDRLGHPRRAARQDVTLRLDADGQLVEGGRQNSGEFQICDHLAACPFVYLVRADERAQVGEILRNLRGAEAAGWQGLALPRSEGGVLRLELREEKPEVTYLDAIAVDVGGTRTLPLACREENPPAYCAQDGIVHRMVWGDRLELEFEMPSRDVPDAAATLVAYGHYVPTPSAVERRPR
ncbi:MAG: hypothetical protein AAGF12_15780 [Myxococcota bacterium]